MAEPNDQNPPPNPEPPANAEAVPPAVVEPPALDPAGAAAPPTVGWAAWTPPEPGAPEPPRRLAVRVLEGIAWTVGILAVLFLGRAFVLFRPGGSLSAFQQGEIIGRMIGAVLAGVVIRWIWIKLRKRGSVRSPWVLLFAAIGLAFGIVSTPGLLPVPASTPIGTYLKVGTPYVLESAPPEFAASVDAAIGELHASAVEVRQISSGSEAVAYLVVANVNADASDEFMRGVESGFEKNAGAEAHADTVNGKPVVVGSAPGGSMVLWSEAPYGLILYVADVESGKAIAASIIAAYQPGIAP